MTILAIVLCLNVKHLLVLAALCHKLIVAATFYNASVFQKHYAIAELCRGKTVRNKDCSFSLCKIIVFLVDFAFGKRVQGAGWFVKDDNRLA